MRADEPVISATVLEDLPAPAARVLDEFVAALLHAAGPKLASAVLFGSGAEGRLRSTSDLNLLVVADDLTLSQLDAVRSALRAGRSAAGLAVMFLESTEVAAASEAFAVKFSDIKARHRVLYGRSPFDSMQVSREAALRRARQVLLNLTLRLRERYVIEGDHEEQLARLLADVTGPIRASAATVIAVRDGRHLAPKVALEELFADASWSECLNGMSVVHRGEQLPAGATRRLFADVFRLLAALGAIVRQLE
jgi:predicted nucleotidyltransferase